MIFRSKKINKITKQIEDAEHFNVDFNVGLNDEQVQSRIEDGLDNKIEKRVSKTYWQIFKDNIFNLFTLTLLGIAALMIAAKMSITNFAFLVILAANTGIGLFQDFKARHLVNKLKVISDPTAKIVRNGKIVRLKTNNIVYSDIIELTTGDQIPCDGVLVDGFIEVNESLLTGESVAIEKEVGSNVLSGSFVVSGTCRYRVCKVGSANYAEQLQNKAKEFKRPKSEILKSLNKIFRFTYVAVLATAIFAFALFAIQGKLSIKADIGGKTPFQQTVEGISWSLISMIPSGMSLLTSVTLTVGVINLARKRMLVQELYCIEMLARTDVVCFDKTGTITDGTMKLSKIHCVGKEDEKEIKEILNTLVTATKDTNASATAIKKACNLEKILGFCSGFPFNSERKISAVMLDNGLSYVLGAREFIPHKDKHIDELCQKYEEQGLRVLVLGYQKETVSKERELKHITLSAIIVLEDHIRDDAIENIKWFQENDVQIRIISGDNPLSVSAIAKKVGVKNCEKLISLEAMPLEEVRKIATKYVVFGRVSPEQKEVIVKALKDSKHTVAMTGDGVNDILALKVADCSIAMASGSDAAKNVSHLVALDSNFSTLPKVVAEGRRVINNLQRTCSLFLAKTIFATAITVFCLTSSIFSSTINIPFAPPNMYVWETLTIGIGSLFLSLQPNDERIDSTFLRNILRKCVPGGVLQIVITAGCYLVALCAPGVISRAEATSLAVFCFSITSFIYFVRICYPLDKFRTVLVSGLTIVTIGMFVIDNYFFKTKSSILKIDYSVIGNNWWLALLIILAGIPLYILVEYIVVKIQNHLDKKYLMEKQNANI